MPPPEVTASCVPSGDHTAEVALVSPFNRTGPAVLSESTTHTPPEIKATRLLSDAQATKAGLSSILVPVKKRWFCPSLFMTYTVSLPRCVPTYAILFPLGDHAGYEPVTYRLALVPSLFIT